MDTPEEIAKLDPDKASEDLAGAPEMVRRADVWMQDHLSRRGRTATQVFIGLSPFIGMFSALPVVAMTGSEGIGAAAMVGVWALGVGTFIASRRAWGRTAEWAGATVARYRKLQDDMGFLGHRAPEPSDTASVDRMVGRIAELAGDRDALTAAAQQARTHISELERELEHLAAAHTGNPEADAVLDAASERIHRTIAQTQARVAEVYAGLIEERASEGDDVTVRVGDSLARLQADLEVEGNLRKARMSRSRSQQKQ